MVSERNSYKKKYGVGGTVGKNGVTLNEGAISVMRNLGSHSLKLKWLKLNVDLKTTFAYRAKFRNIYYQVRSSLEEMC